MWYRGSPREGDNVAVEPDELDKLKEKLEKLVRSWKARSVDPDYYGFTHEALALAAAKEAGFYDAANELEQALNND